ncbi:MAG: aminotransferase class V-fold PLP-dependent enzyme [Candidatus Shikimatogenerans bostrichidophilus]|nr:MAG: aminotransferase class V-fold PLP-dependent enzyme [Candidatus Shikimatogenerans bostrichidophilus]
MENKIINLDNASNTRMRKEIINIYKKIISDKYISNPSSFHNLGRYSKSYIEISREKISNIINCDPSEIIFTSSGTEGNNIILRNVIKNYNIKYIVSSKLEHLSVLNTIKSLNKENKIKVFFIDNDEFGNLNLNQLKGIIKKKKSNILVSIMYVNNEIGNINNINKIGEICNKYNVLFHSDFVQYIGHYKINVKKILCHFFSVSAHKFYGPLGIGFIYIKTGYFLTSFITGGNQERNIRSGTENLYGIVCMYKALKICNRNYYTEKRYILNLKKFCIFLLNKNIKNLKYNGLSNKINKSVYNILNLRLPIIDDLLHIKLDLKNIIISKGSSCYNNKKESHVIKNILNKKDFNRTTSIRISFSIYNKKEDIILFVKELKKIIFKVKRIC